MAMKAGETEPLVLTFFMNGASKYMPRITADTLGDAEQDKDASPVVVTTFSMDGRFTHSVRSASGTSVKAKPGESSGSPLSEEAHKRSKLKTVGVDPNSNDSTASQDNKLRPKRAENIDLRSSVASVGNPCTSSSSCGSLVRISDQQRRDFGVSTPEKYKDQSARRAGDLELATHGNKVPFTVQTAHDSIDSEPVMRLNLVPVTCSICCDAVTGPKAAFFACQHGWYCKQCLARYAETKLANLSSAALPCPDCNKPVPEHEWRQLLPGPLMDQLLARSLERAVAASTDLFACPTPDCPMRVELRGKHRSARLRCSFCKKQSCLRCGSQPYHVGLTCDQHAKSRLGGIKASDDEASLREWLEKTGSRQCPTCKMAITKNDLGKQATQHAECHKMLCRCCGTKFCFKCLAILTDSFSCGCAIDAHGFINPHTGRLNKHLRQRKKRNRS
eukprot:TRINITY_DN818_c0_g2_i2.p1 TRINITY_DN818_c0_g2~~TRINITY_DN818_c0_g2_i2.p1  ORF type:complete len:446 (+),score=50.99 TRINITY_DN818_c0_g2_i2:69-1406(+)